MNATGRFCSVGARDRRNAAWCLLLPPCAGLRPISPVPICPASFRGTAGASLERCALNHPITADRLRAEPCPDNWMTTATLPPTAFASPAILLSGAMDQLMYRDFRSQLDQASDRNLVVVALSTLGGDPEVARTMGEDIRFHRSTAPERRFVFLGRAMVYSAGTTFMS